MKKKLVSCLMTICLAVGIVPVSSMAVTFYDCNPVKVIRESNGGPREVEEFVFNPSREVESYKTTNSDGTTTITYTYDSLGQLIKQKGVSKNEGYSNDYTYDNRGNITSSKFVNTKNGFSSTDTYTYDKDNNMLTSKHTSSTGENSVTVWTYDASGNMLTEDVTSNFDTSYIKYYSYNAAGKLELEKYASKDGSTDANYEYRYTYNASGDVTKEQYISGNNQGYTTVITYDSARRPIKESAVYDRGYSSTHSFTYDSKSRLKTENFSDSTKYSYTYSWTYDSHGNPISENYSESLNGKVQSSYKTTTSYTYDKSGRITLEKVTYSSGYWSSTAYTYGNGSTVPNQKPAVQISDQKLMVDAVIRDCQKYNIDGANYFKLRDLAYLLNNTGSAFAVGYDASTNTVIIETGSSYIPDGTELTVGKDLSSTAVKSSQTIRIDGYKVSNLSVYNIGGNNYFKLRDLGNALGFDVDYDDATRTAIVMSH